MEADECRWLDIWPVFSFFILMLVKRSNWVCKQWHRREYLNVNTQNTAKPHNRLVIPHQQTHQTSAIFQEKVTKMIWGFGPDWFCITYKECMLMWDSTNKTAKAWKQINSWDVVIEDRHRKWHVFIHHVMCWRMLELCKPWARENNHSLWCYVNCYYTHADVSAS